MWAVWLNRVGIILNFVAGFLVAPELLGIKRVEAVEEWLKQTARNIVTDAPADTAGEELSLADPLTMGCLFLLIAPVLIFGWLIRYWLWGDIIWKNWKYGKPLLWLDLGSTLG